MESGGREEKVGVGRERGGEARWNEVEGGNSRKRRKVEVKVDRKKMKMSRKESKHSNSVSYVTRYSSSATSSCWCSLTDWSLLLLLLLYKESFLQFVIDETSLNFIFMKEKRKQSK